MSNYKIKCRNSNIVQEYILWRNNANNKCFHQRNHRSKIMFIHIRTLDYEGTLVSGVNL